MMEDNLGTGSIVCGTIGLVVSIASWVVFGCIGIIGLILGIVGLALPTSSFGKKVPALLSVIVGGSGALFWTIMFAMVSEALA